LQDAAIKIIGNDNCMLYLGRRAINVISGDDGNMAKLVMDFFVVEEVLVNRWNL
jgi:hypothetical protein